MDNLRDTHFGPPNPGAPKCDGETADDALGFVMLDEEEKEPLVLAEHFKPSQGTEAVEELNPRDRTLRREQEKERDTVVIAVKERKPDPVMASDPEQKSAQIDRRRKRHHSDPITTDKMIAVEELADILSEILDVKERPANHDALRRVKVLPNPLHNPVVTPRRSPPSSPLDSFEGNSKPLTKEERKLEVEITYEPRESTSATVAPPRPPPLDITSGEPAQRQDPINFGEEHLDDTPRPSLRDESDPLSVRKVVMRTHRQTQDPHYQNVCNLCFSAVPVSQAFAFEHKGSFYHKRCFADLHFSKDELIALCRIRCQEQRRKSKLKTPFQRFWRRIVKFFRRKPRTPEST